MKKVFALVFVTLLLLTSCADNRTVDEIFSDVKKMVNEKEYEKAVDELKLIPERFTEDSLAVESIYKTAEIYMQNIHDFEKAAQNYSKIANNYPSSEYSPKSRFMAGFLFANKVNNLEKAKEEYGKFLQEYPNHELKQSVKFELRNLGVPIEKIDELKDIVGQKDSVKVKK
jgi:outer membrane protein assembly factor BamD (BamD/ComL family)